MVVFYLMTLRNFKFCPKLHFFAILDKIWNFGKPFNKKKMKISKIPAQNFCITFISTYTVEPLKTDTPRDRPKCPSYRGSEKHWHPTKRVKSSAYCGRIGSNKHKNGLLEQSKDLTVSCILWNHHSFISQDDLHTMLDKIWPIWVKKILILDVSVLRGNFQ